MRSALLLVCSVLPMLLFSQQVEKHITYAGENIGFYEYKPSNYAADPNAKFPLIIFLHGIGERGNGTSELWKVKRIGIPATIAAGDPMRFTVGGKTHSFIVLSPQCATKYGMWPTLYVDALLEYAERNLKIDKKRIYLTGLSMGGGGTWKYISASENNAKKFAAIATVCAPATLSNPCVVAKTKLPMWSFHASNDPVVSVSVITNAINQILGCSPAIKPLKTVWNTGGHEIWDKAYNTKHTYQTPNVFEWFLGYTRDGAVNDKPTENPKPQPNNGNNNSKNQAPVAVAGADKVVNLPINTVLLVGAGSHDKDGYLQRVQWTKVGGPSGGAIQNANAVSARLTGLNAGIYKYRLTVTDNKGAQSHDDIQVRVNLPPTVRTTGNHVLYLPNKAVTLQAWQSTDPDDWIQKIEWTKISGPGSSKIETPTKASTRVSNLQKGGHWFRVTMTDAYGNYSWQNVHVLVQDKPYPASNSAAVVSNAMALDAEDSAATASTARVETPAGATVVPSLYPNPAGSSITVSFTSTQEGRSILNIFDVSGKVAKRLVFEKSGQYFQQAISLGGLGKGVYTIAVMVDGKALAPRQFVKE